ncbi:hypothetical protein GKJPGBOP_05514 [Streptomyces paromomycinus]|uniref:Uncharacterized protein n=1 Tax=Streptomyces paromomycinus TaxID=92743 RepID=A0A401W8X5_STREY|nr:hypothetical protein GKJPGBOP_05514 [Streptomyces paromomycinus]
MNEPTRSRTQGPSPAGDVGSTTGSAGPTPSGQPLSSSPAGGVTATPSDAPSPHHGHRRRMQVNLDGHLELTLYASPRLLRWIGSILTATAAAAWYLNNH